MSKDVRNLGVRSTPRARHKNDADQFVSTQAVTTSALNRLIPDCR